LVIPSKAEAVVSPTQKQKFCFILFSFKPLSIADGLKKQNSIYWSFYFMDVKVVSNLYFIKVDAASFKVEVMFLAQISTKESVLSAIN
jgi:hypothetical protein